MVDAPQPHESSRGPPAPETPPPEGPAAAERGPQSPEASPQPEAIPPPEGLQSRRPAGPGPELTAVAATGPVRRHHGIVRLTHWSTFVLVFGMIASGLQIYRAYPRFGERGGRYLPNVFQDVAFPEWARLGGWLAAGINWHLALAWPLLAAGMLYLAYLALSGEWRKLVFRPRDVPPAVRMARYYLRLEREHPPQGKHNALQKAAYTFILFLGAVAVLSGFAIWKPVQLSGLTALFGGFQAARYWHFWAVWIFVGFTVVHVALVFLADRASLRAMITGRYRGRYTSDEP